MQDSELESAPGIWIAIREQMRSLALVIGTVFLLGVVILIVYYSTDVNVRLILSDPAETALLPEYSGLYSSIGVLVLWTASVAGMMSARFGRFSTPEHKRFVVTFAVIIGFLALDDLLMLHEWGGLILARISGAEDIGQARSALESIVFGVILLVIFAWMWVFRSSIWRSPWPLMVLGGIGFAASISLDLAPYLISALENQPMRVETMLAVAEDLLKMVGIGGLAAYGFALALAPLNRATNQPADLETQ